MGHFRCLIKGLVGVNGAVWEAWVMRSFREYVTSKEDLQVVKIPKSALKVLHGGRHVVTACILSDRSHGGT